MSFQKIYLFGIPPDQPIEFTIDLVPRVALVSKPLYQTTLIELLEIENLLSAEVSRSIIQDRSQVEYHQPMVYESDTP